MSALCDSIDRAIDGAQRFHAAILGSGYFEVHVTVGDKSFVVAGGPALPMVRIAASRPEYERTRIVRRSSGAGR